MSEVLERVILAAAAQRADGGVLVSELIDPDAATSAIKGLLAKGWVRAVAGTPDKPVWVTDDKGRTFAFEITEAGRQAAMARLAP